MFYPNILVESDKCYHPKFPLMSNMVNDAVEARNSENWSDEIRAGDKLKSFADLLNKKTNQNSCKIWINALTQFSDYKKIAQWDLFIYQKFSIQVWSIGKQSQILKYSANSKNAINPLI